MTSPSTKDLSAFGKAAIGLDVEFSQFQRLAREIEAVQLNSDAGMERARRLFSHFDECGQKIGAGMQALASSLDEARQLTDAAAKSVAERAHAMKQRQQETEQLMERYRALGEMVGKTNEAVTQLRPLHDAGMTNEVTELLASRLPEFTSQLGVLVEEARKLMRDAHEANMKTLERNADSLRQSLQAAQSRLEGLAKRNEVPPVVH